MSERLAAWKPLLYALADGASFLFTTASGLLVLLALVLVAAATAVAGALRERRLLAEAAGRPCKPAEAFGVALARLGSLALSFATRLSLLAGLALALVATIAAADSLRRLDEYVANRERIAELTATVRNLERRRRVADVSVLASSGGRFVAEFTYYAGDGTRIPQAQRVELRGRELYVDAVVCSFAYSEIASGRESNLALPYRAFSDEVPAAEGESLALLDELGVPRMYRLPDAELYGIAPGKFAARLQDVAAFLRDEAAARAAGVVRSLQGVAVHRPARPGERFTIWVEATGGITIKDDRVF